MAVASQIMLPLFPLDLVILPGEQVPLHIFEERYQDLLKDCRKEDATFGIPSVRKTNLQPFGSRVKLVRVIQDYKTGESDIVVEGVEPIRVQKYFTQHPGKTYPGGMVSTMPVEKEVSEGFRLQFLQFLAEFGPVKNLSSTGSLTTWFVANRLHLNQGQKYHLLSLSDQQDREQFLGRFMKYLLLLQRQEQTVEDGFYLN